MDKTLSLLLPSNSEVPLEDAVPGLSSVPLGNGSRARKVGRAEELSLSLTFGLARWAMLAMLAAFVLAAVGAMAVPIDRNQC